MIICDGARMGREESARPRGAALDAKIGGGEEKQKKKEAKEGGLVGE